MVNLNDNGIESFEAIIGLGGDRLNFFKRAVDTLKEFEEVLKGIEDNKNQLIQVFSSKSKKKNEKIIKMLKENFPSSSVIGVSSYEIIDDKEVKYDKINITVLNFENTSVNKIRATKSTKRNAKKIINNLIEEETKVIIAFSDGEKNNGDRFVRIFNEMINQDIILAGGRAGDGLEAENVHVFDKEGIIKEGTVAVSLTGEDLCADWYYNMGWEGVTREMEVTKSNGEIVYELDGRNIFEVYSDYLGEDIIDDLPSAAVAKFPLLLTDKINNARSAITNKNNGIKFAGELPEKSRVKISYGSLNKILENAYKLNSTLTYKPEASLVYSCSARNFYLNFLESDLKQELKFIAGKNISGFCTHGEYGLVNNECHLFNITTTVLYLSENKEPLLEENKKEIEIQEQTNPLSHLTNKVVEQTNKVNEKMQIINENIEEVIVEKTCQKIFQILFEDKEYTGGILLKQDNKLSETYIKKDLEQKVIKIFETLWDKNYKKVQIKKGILGYDKCFLIPLTKKVEGIIVVLSNEIDLYDIRKNKIFINQIPNYIKNSRLYESLKENLASLTTLEQTSDFLYSTLDLDKLYNYILDVVAGTMGMSGGIIFKKQNDKINSIQNIGIEEKSGLYYYLKGRSEEILSKNEILFENNEEIYEEIKTLLAIPINLDEYQGVLFSFQKKFKRVINENKKKFLRTLSNQIKVSIKNALSHQKVKELSIRDRLTKLYNHSYFQERLKDMINQNFALTILDIDHFKDFNDVYGHQAGDEVLRELAKLLKYATRDKDLVARYGGEEFIIVFNIINKNKLNMIINRLMERIRQMEVYYEQEKLQVTVSIGVTINQPRIDSTQLIKQADEALYAAKNSGRDTIKFYDEIDKE